MRKNLTLLFALLIVASSALGQVSLTTLGSAYTQDFNSLVNTGTSSTVPAGWAFAESGTNANTTYTAGTGSATTGDTYSFGSASATDRAFGGLQSGTLIPTIGASFTNNTGSTVVSLAVSYTGEEWRLGTRNRFDSLQFQLSLDATSLTTGTWTRYTSLDFHSPDTTAPTGARDGNTAGERTALSFTITGLSISNGSTFWIRWSDFNASGADDGLSVDDFSLTLGGSSSNPSGTGASNPSSVIAGNTTVLTVKVTPGTSPTSTGLAVSGDLSNIGGSPTQMFFDDGSNGDTTSGDNVFSYLATVAGNTSGGLKNLPISISDAQLRSGSTSINVTVLAPTNPTGSGVANPSTVNAGGPTVLTVVATPGANPASSGLTVTGNLSTIGGSSSQTFYDDGSHGDTTASDNVFTFLATVSGGTSAGVKSLPDTVRDAQSRSSAGSISLTVTSPPPVDSIVISQVYGAGGNGGATYLNDYIEIFNRTGSTYNLSGWSIQYAAAAGTAWSKTDLSGSIGPGKYYLIQEASAGANGTGLPAPDTSGSIAMAASAGKVALVASTTLLSGSCPTGGNIVDFVGYGATATCFEGTGPTAAPGATTAVFRNSSGCTDNNDNTADFTAATPSARNTSSPAHLCSVLLAGTLTASGGSPLDGRTVRLIVNGTDRGSTTTGGGTGSYSFSVSLAANDICLVYVDNDTTIKANTVTRIDTPANISDFNLIQGHVRLRHESASSSMTNALLNTVDADVTGDPDVMFAVDGSNKLTISLPNILIVELGKTFIPGGDVQANGLIIYGLGGSFDCGSNTLTITGFGTPFDVLGTFLPGTGTVKYTGVLPTTIEPTTYNNLEVDAATTYSMGGSFGVNNVTVASGAIFHPGFTLTGTGALNLNGLMDVSAMTFDSNYTGFSAYNFNAGSEVRYNGTTGPQTVKPFTYQGLSLANTDGGSLGGDVTVNGQLQLGAIGTLSIGSHTLTIKNPIAGTQTNLTAVAASSIAFEGSGTIISIPSSVTLLNNLTLNNPDGALLNAGLAINGTLSVLNGILYTGANTIDLGATGSLLESGGGKIVVGKITATRSVAGIAPATSLKSAPRTSLANEAFGGIGLELDPNGGTSPGSTTVTRVTDDSLAGSGGSHSIRRYYDVSAATDTGLNATLVFHYDDASSELNGRNENKLLLYRSATGAAPWTDVGYSSRDGGNNTITLNGVTNLSRWTASDSAHRLVQKETISIFKFKDTDGDTNTIESAKRWHLSLYHDSISPGSLVTEADTSLLVAPNLLAGTYIACEADSGASWKRINGNMTGCDTLIVVDGQDRTDRFINFRPNTIVVNKLQDSDGVFGTSGDRTPKSWYLRVVQGIVNSWSSTSGTLTINNLPDGNYTISEADSSGWSHIGYMNNGTPVASGTNSLVISVSNGQTSVIDFVNYKQKGGITILKFKDTDGNANTIESLKPWHLALYRTSVSGGNLVAEADTAILSVPGLTPGTYIAVESDSGASWIRINGNQTRYDTLALIGDEAIADTFINFRPNSITVRKYEDDDGNFGTTGDRVLKAWYVEVVGKGNSPSGTVVAGNLGDGSYTAQEADSAGWIHLGYLVDGIPTAAATNSVGVNVSNGQNVTVDFVNAPPVYNQMFRSFRQDSLALDRDNKGKVGKYVKRKTVRSDFSFTIIPNDSINDLHVEFDQAIEQSFPFTISPSATSSNPDGKGKKWDFTFSTMHHSGDSVTISGFGNKGKAIKVGKYYWTRNGTIVGAKLKNPAFTRNIAKFPMPNRVNALFETFEQGGFGAAGLHVGTAHPEAPKQYAWLVSPKCTDVLKTLKDKTGVHNPNTVKCLGFYDNTKPMKGLLKSIPPSKQNNGFLADLVALKLNIAASQLGKTPVGFGELMYTGDADTLTNVLKGRTISDIARYADSAITSFYDIGGRECSGGVAIVDSVIKLLNDAFEGPLDTLSFGSKLFLKGTRHLIDVPYLAANPNIQPTIITGTGNPVAQIPDMYKLYQNYPNPFNPTTTISFDLPEEALVTLKVYNVLGQEVATLLDHEQMEDGAQEVEFNAGSLASGVYFYRIVAQSFDDEGALRQSTFTSVMKMLLVK